MSNSYEVGALVLYTPRVGSLSPEPMLADLEVTFMGTVEEMNSLGKDVHAVRLAYTNSIWFCDADRLTAFSI